MESVPGGGYRHLRGEMKDCCSMAELSPVEQDARLLFVIRRREHVLLSLFYS